MSDEDTPRTTTRRELLVGTLGIAGVILLSCGDDDGGSDSGPGSDSGAGIQGATQSLLALAGGLGPGYARASRDWVAP